MFEQALFPQARHTGMPSRFAAVRIEGEDAARGQDVDFPAGDDGRRRSGRESESDAVAGVLIPDLLQAGRAPQMVQGGVWSA